MGGIILPVEAIYAFDVKLNHWRLLLRDVACHCLAKLRIDLICDRQKSN